jgi:ABC-type Fe3+-siderophore transport system permease subunit
MDAELIGRISGGLVILPAIPYAVRVWQRKTKPNITSWSLWTVVGFALLVTYWSSGARESIWPAVFGFTNPFIITVLAIWRHKEKKLPALTRLEKACCAFGLSSLCAWIFVHDDPSLAQYALYLAMAADACAAIPTFLHLLKHPDEDRPLPWLMFAFGYLLAAFAVTQPTFSNYALPTYMFIGSVVISIPLVVYRRRERHGWREWI